jgi:hypothetical protein
MTTRSQQRFFLDIQSARIPLSIVINAHPIANLHEHSLLPTTAKR